MKQIIILNLISSLILLLVDLVSCFIDPHSKHNLDFVKIDKIKSKKIIAEVPIHPEFEVAGSVPVDILIPQKICPPEYELIDQKCIKSSTTDPQLVCEEGYKFLDGNCYRTEKSKAETICPVGFHKIGLTKCLEVHSVEPKLHCREGVLNNDEKCIHVRRRDPKLVCDTGYTMSPDGFCFRADKTKPGVVCPQDSTPTTKGCVKYKETRPDIYCLTGYSMEDGKCVKEKFEKKLFRCEEGFVLSKDPKNIDKAECIKVIKSPGKEYCEEGEMKNGKCIAQLTTLPEIVCRPGFSLKEGKCYKLLEEDPGIRCEAGYKYDGVRCVDIRIRPTSLLCGEGQISKLGFCEKIISQPPISECRTGFQSTDGKCVKKYYKDAKLKCSGRGILVNDMCKSQEIVESSDVCEHDAKREGLFCVSFDTVPPNVVCGHDEELAQDNLSCIKKIVTKPDLVCLPEFNLQGDECVRSTQIQVDMICPVDADLKANFCTKTIRSAPLVSCRFGYTLNNMGECECTDSIDPTHVCPTCYTLVDEMCMPNHTANIVGKCAFKKLYKA